MQPLPGPMQAEVRLGGVRRPAGLAFDSEEAQEDMRSAHGTLTAVAAEGLYALRCEGMYILEFHFRTREDWIEFLNRPKAGGVDIEQKLLDTALARDDGLVVLTEETFTGVYDRVDSS